EVARAHACRGHRRQIGRALIDVVALIVEKEEGFVFRDRAAERAAELALPEIGFVTPRAVVEEVVGVENAVAEELEAAAVDDVGARLDLQVDDAAERAAE